MFRKLIVFTILILLFPILSSAVEFDLPEGRKLILHGYLENQTIMRSTDFEFSKSFGLAMFRNTIEPEITIENLFKDLWFIDRADLFLIHRFVYDGIYDMRTSAFGNNASGFTPPPPPFGIGIHPDQRFRLMGGTPLRAAVPWRPTKKIHCRGCTNLNKSEAKLKFDFTDSNDEYGLREFYLDMYIDKLWVRLGKQQTVWGKTDFFRLQDIPNPMDVGWHYFLEPFEDIRIPQWTLRTQYPFGSIGPLDEVALELVWLFDDFEPVGGGQAGQPWAHFTSGIKRAQVANHDAFIALGLLREQDPDWSFGNTEWGIRLEWLYKDFRFALTNWYGWKDIPTVDLMIAYSPAFPAPGVGLPFGGLAQLIYGRFNTTGLAVDYFEQHTSTVWRLESSFTFNEVRQNTNRRNWMDTTDMLRWALGIDRPTMIPFLNRTRTFFMTGQIFAEHALQHRGGSKTGMNFDRDEWILTFMTQTQYFHDRLAPQVWVAWSPNAGASGGGVNAEWLITDHWSVKAGMHWFVGRERRHDIGPFTPFASPPFNPGGNPPPDPFQEDNFGYFRESFSDIWSRDRDEVFFRLRYRF